MELLFLGNFIPQQRDFIPQQRDTMGHKGICYETEPRDIECPFTRQNYFQCQDQNHNNLFFIKGILKIIILLRQPDGIHNKT